MEFDNSMPEFYAYPIISRVFFLKDSVLNSIYEQLEFDQYPRMMKWIKYMQKLYGGRVPDLEILNKDFDKSQLYNLPGHQDLGPAVPAKYFHLWLEELVQMKDKGKKPPLRIPFIYTNLKGQKILAKM